MTNETVRYQLVNYFDVWGNAKDGWEVNNLCKEEIYIETHESVGGEVLEKIIIAELKQAGFLKKTVRRNMVEMDLWEQDMIEIRQRKDQMPIGRLELIRD